MSTHHQKSPSRNHLHPRLQATALLAGFVLVAGLMVLYKSFATSDSLSLHPARSDVSLGSNLKVTILAHNASEPVNAVQADLLYDQTKLQLTNINTTTSAFPGLISAKGDSGTVHIALNAGSSGSVGGSQVVAVVSFTAIGVGTTAIRFAPEGVFLRATDSANILIAKNGGSYTIRDKAAPTVPRLLSLQHRTETANTLTWSPSSDNTTVRGYHVYRNGKQVANTPHTTYTDTGLHPGTSYSYRISAFDASGNSSKLSGAATNLRGVTPIDVSDLSILASNYGRANATSAEGDLNKDGVVNILDLSLLLTNFGP